ncbi:hypothetical protein GA0074692_0890 [Micromonospora pallida]|uniref:Uncharacterized protein n=1 Tax=Micromonospora pallida TaxID=145854 RepID=A0A1C6RTW8_9ACTN|nr:hypothetical protein GA0074692_0890 [Micromonospora pallida]
MAVTVEAISSVTATGCHRGLASCISRTPASDGTVERGYAAFGRFRRGMILVVASAVVVFMSCNTDV